MFSLCGCFGESNGPSSGCCAEVQHGLSAAPESRIEFTENPFTLNSRLIIIQTQSHLSPLSRTQTPLALSQEVPHSLPSDLLLLCGRWSQLQN